MAAKRNNCDSCTMTPSPPPSLGEKKAGWGSTRERDTTTPENTPDLDNSLDEVSLEVGFDGHLSSSHLKFAIHCESPPHTNSGASPFLAGTAA